MFFLIVECFRSFHNLFSVGLGDPVSSRASIVSLRFSCPFFVIGLSSFSWVIHSYASFCIIVFSLAPWSLYSLGTPRSMLSATSFAHPRLPLHLPHSSPGHQSALLSI